MNNTLGKQIKPLSNREFQKFSHLVYDHCRINLTPAKKTLVSSRLLKRLMDLNLTSYSDYLKLLEDGQRGSLEFELMINKLSTHTTSFFRESAHFDFLKGKALSEVIKLESVQKTGLINIWSAACSSGEEPYTIGMVLSEFIRENPVYHFNLTASDIAEDTLQQARQAVYKKETISKVPQSYRIQYFLKGIRSFEGFYKMSPELRHKVQFKKINLADGFQNSIGKQEIIFCRNVLIYFDYQTKTRIIRDFYRKLVPGGYLFVGHSEGLQGISYHFRSVIPAVYKKPLEC